MHEEMLPRRHLQDCELIALPVAFVAKFRHALKLLVEDSCDRHLTVNFRFELNVQAATEVTQRSHSIDMPFVRAGTEDRVTLQHSSRSAGFRGKN